MLSRKLLIVLLLSMASFQDEIGIHVVGTVENGAPVNGDFFDYYYNVFIDKDQNMKYEGGDLMVVVDRDNFNLVKNLEITWRLSDVLKGSEAPFDPLFKKEATEKTIITSPHSGLDWYDKDGKRREDADTIKGIKKIWYSKEAPTEGPKNLAFCKKVGNRGYCAVLFTFSPPKPGRNSL